MKKPAAAKDDFLDVLEQGVRDVLKDGNADAKDRMKAIEVGGKLVAIRAKISDEDKGSFFK